MDRLLLSFLNSRLDAPDPFETPLGSARWWASVHPHVPRLAGVFASKPRFDAGLAAALRDLRAAVSSARAGTASELRFTGAASADAVLFPIAYAATAVLETRAERLKDCALLSCGRCFLDETKNGSKRWCSLACMERARAPRRQAARRRVP